MEGFEPREPIESNEFTLEELMLINRALLSEHLYICFPPLDEEALKVSNRVSQKVLNLIAEHYDKQRDTNG